MKKALVEVTPITVTITIGIFLLVTFITNQTIFAETYMDLVNDDTRATTLYFSIKPLDNWAYGNAAYGSMTILGGFNDAIEMFPNEFDNSSQVYGMMAHDGYYTMKNTKLEHYVNFKKNQPNLKGIEESKLLSQQDFDINGTKAVKLTYDNSNTQHKYVLYLTQHDKDKYVMYYYGKYDLFDKYLPEFEKMIKTIKWLE